MNWASTAVLGAIASSVKDLLPVILVIACFQFLVVGEPLPDTLAFLQGMLFVVLGLTLFVYGLEQGVFPIGERMAEVFARKGSVPLLLLFAFSLGFAATVAEPALIAIAGEAARMAAHEGHIATTVPATDTYALALRLVVALAVGSALVLGVLRILYGWPLHHLIIGGYVMVLSMTPFAPEEIIGIAYDSGGVTTSTITVPLVTALGVGLASSIKGRNPAVDGFGLIAFASLTPMLFVMLYGIVLH